METSAAITRRSGSNLALAFILLPRAKREGMAALYAFCREVDDVADEDAHPAAERARLLAAWRDDIRRACEGGAPEFPVNRELQPVIARHPGLRFELFDELIRGCEQDLALFRCATYAELEAYCHRVASVVGLLSIEIFGYTDPRCREYAVQLGRALQFTNILRDVRKDAARGRLYLPLEELARHGVTEAEVLRGEYSERYARCAAAVAARARALYAAARAALPPAERRAMASAELMGAVYWQLLRRLEARRFDVFGARPVRLSRLHKLALIARAWLRTTVGSATPNYGAAG
jgi:phytoene synthase